MHGIPEPHHARPAQSDLTSLSRPGSRRQANLVRRIKARNEQGEISNQEFKFGSAMPQRVHDCLLAEMENASILADTTHAVSTVSTPGATA